MFKQKKLKQPTIILVTATIFFVLGMAIPSGGSMGKLTRRGSFEDGWKAAEQRLAETGFAPMTGEEMEVLSLNGEIEAINGSKITLKIQPLAPLADPELDIRMVEVAHAKLYQLVEKDQEKYQAEMKAFDKQMNTQMENPEKMAKAPTPPAMFTKQAVKLNDLKVGQSITVTTEHDIKEVKEFKAVEVAIQPKLYGDLENPPMESSPITEGEEIN